MSNEISYSSNASTRTIEKELNRQLALNQVYFKTIKFDEKTSVLNITLSKKEVGFLKIGKFFGILNRTKRYIKGTIYKHLKIQFVNSYLIHPYYNDSTLGTFTKLRISEREITLLPFEDEDCPYMMKIGIRDIKISLLTDTIVHHSEPD